MNDLEAAIALKQAECLYTDEQVQSAIDRVALEITKKLSKRNPLVLCVMTGALIPAGHILTRLNFPLQLDYIHATRYRGDTRGGVLNWLVKPTFPLQGRDVLIIDDIFDEGITLSEIVEFCSAEGANDIFTAVLVNKIHNRKTKLQVDFVGLETEDKYLFGYGMDYHNYLRNAPGIYAVKE
ncbi:Hypoxanthine-guanine phosphoribosyltransferase [hydrothermal vent metagenome]|uniref:Hypoxanthine-guanine phosphoribosyltransferase n=1 Tax=hydrothermal vent metagenome TaxID=652676 RepID=A0A3B1AAY4_9ZZZZ